MTKNSIPALFNFTTRIKSMKLVDFIMENIEDNEKSKLDSALFFFENSANYRIEPALKQITILFNIALYSDSIKTKKLAEMQLLGDFEIGNLDDFKDKDEYKFPQELLATFLGLMLSSARGMLIVKTENTYLENAIIPIMNPMDFFKVPTP